MLATTPARSRARSTIFRTIAGVLAVTTATLFAGVGAATAAIGDSSSARGQFLSGSLLGTDLATLIALEGAEAASDGSADDLESNSLDLAVLQALELELAGGLQVPLAVTDLGVVDQYAEANADGSSLGASGAVADDGAIGVGPVGPGGAPTAFSFDLSDLLAGVVNTGAITDLDLELGAVSAQATGDGVSAPTGDYEIAGLRLVMDSPAIQGVAGGVETAVDGVVDPLVAGLLGSGGIVDTLEGAVPLLTLGVVGAGATLDVDLDAALDPLIGPAAPALGAGSPIEIDLGDGTITVDVRALLEADADPGNDLNNLDPNTEILSAEVLALITDGVESLLDDLADDIAAAVVTALNDATLDLDLAVSIGGPPVATVDISGTVAEIIASDAGAVEVTVLDATVCAVPVVGTLVCGTLDAVLTGALDTLLTAAVDGLVDDVTAAVQTAVVVPALNLLDPALASVVTGIVSLRANVQEPFPPALGAEFVETALRLTLLGGVTVPGGGAAVLNIAQAAVGPNVAVDPVATDLDPDRGPETGGTVVTITGDNIGDATSVTFDGVPGTGIVVIDEDTISVVSPPHAPGTVDVVVNGPGGSTAPLPFEYYAVVTIDDIDPDQGPEAGGNVVTITGHCFAATTSVTFGGVEALAFTIDSDTQLTVTVPPGTSLVDVVVTTSDPDCGSGTEPDGYAYVAPGAPDVTGIVPDRGPETGGTAVTITGTGFLGASGVTFDGLPGTAFVVVNDTTITAVSPPHAPATVGVVVTHPTNGSSSPEDFEYYPVTTIDDITPDEGPESGGTVVVITGHCFLGATGVTFGGVPATAFTVDSDTQITATVPAGTGLVDVVVAGVGDCGDGELPDGYEYLASPVITGLAPPTGPETGGTPVTITGTGFTGATGVTIDGDPVAFTVVNDTTITFTTPPHVPGSVPVVVLHPVLDSDPEPFLYYPVTTIDDVTPDQGPEAGNTAVVILGHCFTGATQVLFGAIPAASFVVVNDGRIEAITAPGTGLVDVSVVGAGTCGTGTAPDAFAFVGPLAPVVTDIDPDQGPETGNTLVTITGSGFTGVTSVTFDGIPGTALTVVSDTVLTVRTPPHAPAVVDVVVVHPVNGAGAPADFEYIAAAVGGVTVTPGGLGLTGSSPGALILNAVLLLLSGLGLVIATSRRRRPRLL